MQIVHYSRDHPLDYLRSGWRGREIRLRVASKPGASGHARPVRVHSYRARKMPGISDGQLTVRIDPYHQASRESSGAPVEHSVIHCRQNLARALRVVRQ